MLWFLSCKNDHKHEKMFFANTCYVSAERHGNNFSCYISNNAEMGKIHVSKHIALHTFTHKHANLYEKCEQSNPFRLELTCCYNNGLFHFFVLPYNLSDWIPQKIHTGIWSLSFCCWLCFAILGIISQRDILWQN